MQKCLHLLSIPTISNISYSRLEKTRRKLLEKTEDKKKECLKLQNKLCRQEFDNDQLKSPHRIFGQLLQQAIVLPSVAIQQCWLVPHLGMSDFP